MADWRSASSAGGSTLIATWGDPDGEGLRVQPGEPLVGRTELAGEAELGRVLATFAHLTDAHVLDASSPARVPFLARLGAPFDSTFRPQEALTVSVLAGAVRAIRAFEPDFVIQGGDLIDNVQDNELTQALAVLAGGEVRPGSGPAGYFGVQSSENRDAWYYRPDLDEPRHPGLLRDAVQGFRSAGLGCPCLPVLGDHDLLVAGELVVNPLTAGLAVGDRALWTLPEGLSLPPGTEPGGEVSVTALAGEFVAAALAGPTVEVPADPSRRELGVGEVVARLRESAGLNLIASPDRLDYVYDVGERLRLIVLDLACRDGGSGGRVEPSQLEFVSRALSEADDRWVVCVTHQTLRQSAGGEELQSILDGSPRLVLLLNGHTHHNRIRPRETPAGGHWEIETSSLIDWPQQCRALRLYETLDGGVAIQTWMLDHVCPERVGTVSRELAWMDESGGRPGRFAGAATDRNAVLYLPSR